LLISIGFLGTALTLHRFTIINLQIDFHAIVMLRAAQVLFLPLIFIPISTLNYVGVPREKNNQVSGLSNFARNLRRQHWNIVADDVPGAPKPDSSGKLRGSHRPGRRVNIEASRSQTGRSLVASHPRAFPSARVSFT